MTLPNAFRFVFVGALMLGGAGLGCHGCGRRYDSEASAQCASSATEDACKACCKKHGDRGHEHGHKCRCVDP